MPDDKSGILQGTLDLMVLKALETMGPQHGYWIARRIEQISEDALQLNQGTIYSSLTRLLQKKWISAEWGTSENKRKAKFYSITKAGRKHSRTKRGAGSEIAGVIGRVLRGAERRTLIVIAWWPG